MERTIQTENDLKRFIGMQVSKEALLGRNYFYVEGGKVVEDLCLGELPDFQLTDNTDFKKYYESAPFPVEEGFYEDEEDIEFRREKEPEEGSITCEKVKAYVASKTTQSGWFKCLPTHPEDVQAGAFYLIVRVRVDVDFKITEIHVFKRTMQGMNGGFGCGGFFVEVPHSESLKSCFSHMFIFPPEILEELDGLTKGRFFRKGFSFIGKPLPSGQDFMNAGVGSVSLARSSAFRNVYWHISIDVDDDDLIEGFEFSCWVNEHSMFQRPESASDEIMDGLDCVLTLLDAYTDEEYESLG